MQQQQQQQQYTALTAQDRAATNVVQREKELAGATANVAWLEKELVQLEKELHGATANVARLEKDLARAKSWADLMNNPYRDLARNTARVVTDTRSGKRVVYGNLEGVNVSFLIVDDVST
jgi:hypothetical protein